MSLKDNSDGVFQLSLLARRERPHAARCLRTAPAGGLSSSPSEVMHIANIFHFIKGLRLMGQRKEDINSSYFFGRPEQNYHR